MSGGGDIDAASPLKLLSLQQQLQKQGLDAAKLQELMILAQRMDRSGNLPSAGLAYQHTFSPTNAGAGASVAGGAGASTMFGSATGASATGDSEHGTDEHMSMATGHDKDRRTFSKLNQPTALRLHSPRGEAVHKTNLSLRGGRKQNSPNNLHVSNVNMNNRISRRPHGKTKKFSNVVHKMQDHLRNYPETPGSKALVAHLPPGSHPGHHHHGHGHGSGHKHGTKASRIVSMIKPSTGTGKKDGPAGEDKMVVRTLTREHTKPLDMDGGV